MDGEWHTYAEAAEKLNVSPEAVRQKAIRGRWQRTKGNDGLARCRLPDGLLDAVRTPSRRPNKTPVRTPSDARLSALEAELAGARGELAGLREALLEARARAEAADARSVELCVDLTAERARTERAIEAFAALADRLDQLATERARPWWRRLAG
jgi:hypothetical protein